MYPTLVYNIIDKTSYNDPTWLINIGFLDKIIHAYFDSPCISDLVKMHTTV